MTNGKMDRRISGPSGRERGSIASSGEPIIKYIRNSRTISGRLHDEMVMMAIEQGKYLDLNQVATRIGDILEHPLDIDGLCRRLLDEYDTSAVQCRRDTEAYIADMMKLGLVIQV